jgi:hypothetical protein
MEKKVFYFEDRKPEDTEITFQLVQERLKGSRIEKLVMASTTGATAQISRRVLQRCWCKAESGASSVRFPKKGESPSC